MNRNSMWDNEKKHELNQAKFGQYVLGHIDSMLAYWDENEVCRFANDAYMEWFGKKPSEMINKITLKELLGPLYEMNLPFIQAALKGNKQVFEREIPVAGGGIRNSIATYFPYTEKDINKGFMVHVADITLIRHPDARLIEKEKQKKHDVLRSMLNVHELERKEIAEALTESVSQTLVHCKMMLEKDAESKKRSAYTSDLASKIQSVIRELNILTGSISPPLIKIFSFNESLQDYISKFRQTVKCTISYECLNEEVESIPYDDKVAIYRIIQGYLSMQGNSNTMGNIIISLNYKTPKIDIRFSNENLQFEMPKHVRAFADIMNRVEYYEGSLKEFYVGNEHVLLIELVMPG